MSNLAWAAFVVASSLAAALGAGYVFDSPPGRPALGFWAAFWGLVTLLVLGTVVLVARSKRPGVRRVAKGLLALTLGFVAYGVLFFAFQTSPFTLEGAWLWPLGLACLVGALWALRGAIAPRG